MSLPQIQEMDPWLEEDEEMYMKRRDSFEKCSNRFMKAETKSFSLTSFITNLAKISVYGYIICRLCLKSSFLSQILKLLLKYSASMKSLSRGSIILSLLLILRFKKRVN
jgi:hypothetical protein